MPFSLDSRGACVNRAIFLALAVMRNALGAPIIMEHAPVVCTVAWWIQNGPSVDTSGATRTMDGRWLAWTSEQQSVVAIREASEQWLLLRGELDGTTCHEASLPVPLRPASVLLNGSPTAFEYLKGMVVFALPVPAQPSLSHLEVRLTLSSSTYRRLQATPSSASLSESYSDSTTASVSVTRSVTKSRSLSRSFTSSTSPTISNTVSITASTSISASVTPSMTGTVSMSATGTRTISASVSASNSPTISVTRTRSSSPSGTPSTSATTTQTRTRSRTSSVSKSASFSVSTSTTPVAYDSPEPAATEPPSHTPTEHVTPTASASLACACGCSSLSCCTNATAEYEEQCRLANVRDGTSKSPSTPVLAPALASAVGGIVLIVVGVIGYKLHTQRREANSTPVPVKHDANPDDVDDDDKETFDRNTCRPPQTVSLDAGYDPDQDVTTVDVDAVAIHDPSIPQTQSIPKTTTTHDSKDSGDNKSLETLDTGSEDTPPLTVSPKPVQAHKPKKQRRVAVPLKTKQALAVLVADQTSPTPHSGYEDTTILRGNSIDKVVGPAFLAQLLMTKATIPQPVPRPKPSLKASRLSAKTPASPTVRQLLRSFAEDSSEAAGTALTLEASATTPDWMRPNKSSTH